MHQPRWVTVWAAATRAEQFSVNSSQLRTCTIIKLSWGFWKRELNMLCVCECVCGGECRGFVERDGASGGWGVEAVWQCGGEVKGWKIEGRQADKSPISWLQCSAYSLPHPCIQADTHTAHRIGTLQLPFAHVPINLQYSFIYTQNYYKVIINNPVIILGVMQYNFSLIHSEQPNCVLLISCCHNPDLRSSWVDPNVVFWFIYDFFFFGPDFASQAKYKLPQQP